MICRIWSGRTEVANASIYEEIVRGQVIPEIEGRAIAGFLHIDIMRRTIPAGVEFTTIMWFENLEAIIDFAGSDYQLSHVPSEAAAVLADYDAEATHFEVLDRRPQPV